MKTIRMSVVCASVATLSGMTTATLVAQDAQPDPTPKQPLISRAADMSAWTITYRYKQLQPTDSKPDAAAGAKPPEQIVSVQVQKTGKTYHRVTNWSSGNQTDSWTVNQRQLVKEKSASTYILLPTEGPATDDYSHSDFEDLTWISMKNFAGFKKAEQSVFVFQAKNSERPLTRRDKYNLSFLNLAPLAPVNPKPSPGVQGPSPAKFDAKTVMEQVYGDTKATVVLDASTQLPIASDDGKVTWAYQFTTAPADTLVPPPEVVKVLQRYTNYVKGTTVHPSAP